jgi:hypothetical protein
VLDRERKNGGDSKTLAASSMDRKKNLENPSQLR